METLFGRRRTISPENSTYVQSAEFAKEVLDLEESLSIEPSADKVRRLVELYTEAISFYEYIGDAKHKHYQDKMHGVLSRRDILSLLGDPRGTKPKPRQFTSDLMHERKADKVLKQHFEVVSQFSTKVFENLHSQCKGLYERIKTRKCTRKGPDIGGGNPRVSFAEALEAIVEKYSDRKREAKNKIEEQHVAEIRETRALGKGEIVDVVVEAIKDRMKAQINKEMKELDQQKKREIEKLREDFHANIIQ